MSSRDRQGAQPALLANAISLAAAGGGHVIFGGGIPVAVGDRVVGAVGVSGATIEQDVACAPKPVSKPLGTPSVRTSVM